MKCLVIAILLFMLTGCAAPSGDAPRDDTGFRQIGGSALSGVYRTVDEQAGVACWVFSSVEKGGIACMPISETKLGRE